MKELLPLFPTRVAMPAFEANDPSVTEEFPVTPSISNEELPRFWKSSSLRFTPKGVKVRVSVAVPPTRVLLRRAVVEESRKSVAKEEEPLRSCPPRIVGLPGLSRAVASSVTAAVSAEASTVSAALAVTIVEMPLTPDPSVRPVRPVNSIRGTLMMFAVLES